GEAAEHAPDRDADVAQETVLGQEVVAFLDHGEGIGQESLGYIATQSGEAPRGHEQNKEQDAERNAGPRRDRRERLHAAAMRWSRSSARQYLLSFRAGGNGCDPGGIAAHRPHPAVSLIQGSCRRSLIKRSLNEARVRELRQIRDLLDDADLKQEVG